MSDFTESLKSFSPLAASPLIKASAPVAEIPAPAADPLLARSLAQIEQALQHSPQLDMMTISQQRDNGMTRDNVILADWNKMDPSSFHAKYGQETYEKVAAAQIGGASIRGKAARDRSTGEMIGDSLISVGSGAVQGLGGAAALGLGLVSDDAGVAASQGLKSIGEFTKKFQSQGLNDRRAVNALRTQLDAADNKAAYEEDSKKFGSFEAGLRAVGREAVSGAKRLTEDPMMAGDMIAEGAGSLLIGGPLAKGLQVGAKAALGARAVTGGVESFMPAAIGLMESGGTYSQTIQEIMAIPDAQLKAQSPDYAQMRQTMSEQDAKVQLATNAGLIGAAVTAPAAVAAGKLVSKFEAAPLSSALGKPVSALGNMGRETLEEGLQSGAGQFAGNLGKVASGADPSQSLIEGVGDQAIQGAIAGAGTAGVLQAPGVVGGAAMAAGQVAMAPLVESMKTKAGTIKKEIAAASPVSEQNVAAEVAAQIQELPQLAEAVRSLADDPAIPEAQKPAVEALAQKIGMIFTMGEDDLATVPEIIREAAKAPFPDGANRFNLMTVASAITASPDVTKEDRVKAALWLVDQTEQNAGFIKNGNEILGNLDHDKPEVQAFQQFTATLEAMEKTPSRQETLRWVQEELEAPKATEKTDLRSQEGQALVSTTADIARLVPEKIDLPTAQLILKQDKISSILTPEQRQNIHAASAQMEAAEAFAKAEGIRPEAKQIIDLVNREIQLAGGNRGHQKSLAQHALDIQFALRMGQADVARARAQNLGKFARAMRNKAEAINQAITAGDRKRVVYETIDAEGKWYKVKPKHGLFYNPGTPASETLARSIQSEAAAAITLANSFAKEYPQFGIKEIAIPTVGGKASTVTASPAKSQATTAKTAPAPKEQETLPPPSSQPSRAPDNVAPKAEAKAPEATAPAEKVKAVSRISPEQAKRLSDDGLNARLERLYTLGEKVTNEDVETILVLQNEDERRELQKQEEAGIVSEISEEEATRLSDEALNKRLDRLIDLRKAGKTTAQDEATFEVLDQEMTYREDEAKEAKANEELDGETASAASPDRTSEPAEPVAPVVVAEPAAVDATESAKSEPTQEKPLDLASKFKNLVRSVGKNMFHVAYTLPKEATSRLLDVEHPMVTALSTLRNPKRFRELTGLPLSAERLQVLEEILMMANTAQDRMNERLAKAESTALFKAQEAGEQAANRFINGRLLNVLEIKDGKHVYNDVLQEAALLAGLDWLLNANAQKLDLDAQELASSLGLDHVSQPMVKFFNRGVSVEDAKSALAKRIIEFWGVKPNNKTDITYTRGVAEAVAIEVIDAFKQEGLLSHVNEDGFLAQTGKTYGRIYFDERKGNTKEVFDSVGAGRTAFGKMALIEDENHTGVSIGSPIERPSRTQLRNRLVNNTKQQIRAILNEQKIAYLPNLMNYKFFQALGEDNFVRLNGGQAIVETLNETHRLSVVGKDLGLRMAYTAVQSQMAEIEDHAKSSGTEAKDVASYYPHEITKAGRFHMVGAVTPAGNKYAREIFMPTRSVLDMTTEDHQQKFWLAAAQGLGIKTEKGTRAINVAEAQSLIDNQYAEVMAELQDWVAEQKRNKDLPLSKDLVDRILAAAKKAGKPFTMHGMHSLLAVAQLKVANEADLKAFETFNYLEADGKTNGVINALMSLVTGNFTQAFLNKVAKGGVFFGKDMLGKTLNSVGDQSDLYGETAALHEQNLQKLLNQLSTQNPQAHEKMQAMLRMLSRMGVKVVFSTDENNNINLKIDRSVTKNPVTITVYGSGRMGIAGNVADEVADLMYAKMSEFSALNVVDDMLETEFNYPGFWDDLNALTEEKVIRFSHKGEYKFVVKQTEDLKTHRPNAKEFKLTRSEYEAFRSNLLTLFVNPMADAIDATIRNDVVAATTSITEATQTQSIVARAMFRHGIITKMLDRQKNDPDWREGDFLSENDLQAILKEVMPYGANISTGTQVYFLGGTEKEDILGKNQAGKNVTITIQDGDTKRNVRVADTFSRGVIGNDYTGGAKIYQPGLAGVSAVPSVVIGGGDGQAMLNAATMSKLDRVLKVFDGLNMPIDSIDGHSELINEAVHRTWTQNKTMRAVEKSFRDFLALNPFDQLQNSADPIWAQAGIRDDFQFEMSKVIQAKGEPDRINDFDKIAEKVNEIMENLTRHADSIDARQAVYQEFPMTVDQMGSGEHPHVQQGIVSLADGEETLAAMQRLYEVKLAQIQKREAPKPVLVTATLMPRQEASAADVRVVEPQALVAGSEVMKELFSGQLSAGQEELLAEALKTLKGSNYRVVIGEPAEVDSWMASNAIAYDPTLVDGSDGFIDTVSKVIGITDGHVETVLHEMIHAATYAQVRTYFESPHILNDVQKTAVKNIQGLMYEWLEQDYSNKTNAVMSARAISETVILGYLVEKQDAAAVNEFMAWVLSNQHLAKEAAAVKVKNPLFKLVGAVLAEIKKLVWGDAKAPEAGESMLNQLRFNTRVLIELQNQMGQQLQDVDMVTLTQSKIFGQSERLVGLGQQIRSRITDWASQMDLTKSSTQVSGKILDRASKEKASYLDADIVAKGFAGQGFLRTGQELSVFKDMVALLALDVEVNPNAATKIQELYDHVIQNLSVEDFMTNMGDPDQDRSQAQNKFNAIHGLYGTTEDEQGRSSLLPSFLALAMVDEEFRKILTNMPQPEKTKGSVNLGQSLDANLETLATAGMERLSDLVSGADKNSASVKASLDRLVNSMIENVVDTRSYIELQYDKAVNGADKHVANYMQNVSRKISDNMTGIINNNQSKAMRAVARVVRVTADLINEENAESMAQGIVSQLNQSDGLNTIRALARDLIGRTKDNAKIFDMITPVRTMVQQTRQQFREELPKILEKKFGKISAQAWSALHRGLSVTDLAALHSVYGVDGSIEMLTNAAKLNAAIQTSEQALKTMDARRFSRIKAKSEQLAHFMLTKDYGVRLARNAYAIARLAGERGYDVAKVDEAMVSEIDRLVTLYAIKGLDKGTKEQLSILAKDKTPAMGFALSYLRGLRQTELDKSKDPNTRINAYKGGIPSEIQRGASFVVAEDSRHNELVLQGYTRIGPYKGSSADRSLGRRSYYHSPVSGKAAYNQGVMQMVHTSAGGVDPQTGFTMFETMAGRITDPKIVALITQQLQNQRATTENLSPVYNAAGMTVAYERTMDPAQLVRLNRDTNLHTMMGAWAGRQVEEQLAQEFNDQLIEAVHEQWEQGKKAGRAREFINLATSKDPIHKDTWGLIPRHSKQKIEELFGKDVFWVRKEMLDDEVGYRSASIGDVFTGQTRWKPGVQQAVQDAALTIFGSKAYTKLVSSERVIQDLVVNAKTLIVVKSVIVPAANLVANMFQLMNRGVPLRTVIKSMGKKTAELNAYIKGRQMEIQLEADLQAAKGVNHLENIRKIESRIKALKDNYRRMSIWPLIEAGEFAAISNGMVTAEDLALAEGRWGDWAEKLTTKVPEGLRTPWRYAFVTRDTALFQGLAKAVQYGDFLGKAILYDDLVQRKNKPKTEAIAMVSEAFVNYNRLPGRTRQALESNGLLWFYNFKLRSVKEAAYIMRHHPLRAMLMMGMSPSLPGVGSVGSPLWDNLVSLLFEGKLGYSMGPGMGLHSFALNPWLNLAR